MAEANEARAAARLLAKLRRPKKGRCPICGRTFETIGPRKYCSEACRHKAYYRRHREEILERDRARRRKGGSPPQARGS